MPNTLLGTDDTDEHFPLSVSVKTGTCIVVSATLLHSVFQRAWKSYPFLLLKSVFSLKPVSSLTVAIGGVFLFSFY